MANYLIYRTTTLGTTLKETLDDMISNGLLTERAATKIYSEFDRSMNIALNKRINKKVQFSGQLRTYRCCDDVWTLVLKDFVVRDSNQGQHNTTAGPSRLPRADKVRIVACDGRISAT